jgi:hypothetical protein
MTETKKKRTRTTIPDEVKAAALADLVLLSPFTVASKYGVSPSTVRSWKARDLPVVLESLQHLATQKRDRIAVLALEYLEANLNALTSQAYVASNPNYINRQPAGELAILHGVLADKSIRLIDALHRGTAHSGDPVELDQLRPDRVD